MSDDKIYKQFKTFIKYDLQEQNFTDSMYKFLMLKCNFIAHYDKRAFFNTYFGELNDILFFVEKLENCSYKGPEKEMIIDLFKKYLEL